MTSGTSGSDRERMRLALGPEEAGTVLGTLAWVMGALEIMKDRGHAEGDEEFHDLYDLLTPRLNRVVALFAGGRVGLGPDEPVQGAIDEAYADVRAAFERWIELTASDTAQVAIGQRLAAALDAADGEDSEAEPADED
ncbi:MAG: hypothetical protein R3C39_02190 [Dehalococcoidia bacterium]